MIGIIWFAPTKHKSLIGSYPGFYTYTPKLFASNLRLKFHTPKLKFPGNCAPKGASLPRC